MDHRGINVRRGRVGVVLIETELNSLIAALQQYHFEFGAFPSGDSVGIQKALQGRNPRGLPFFHAREGPRSLNKKGELLGGSAPLDMT